jgi:hypothetical protein
VTWQIWYLCRLCIDDDLEHGKSQLNRTLSTRSNSSHSNSDKENSNSRGDDDDEMEQLVKESQQSPLSTSSSTATTKALMACLNYSFCSVSMILVNKSLASR